jgi:hypothetical protein
MKGKFEWTYHTPTKPEGKITDSKTLATNERKENP